MNNTQISQTPPYQDPQQAPQMPKRKLNPVIKIILLIIFGIIIGAGVMSIFLFVSPKENNLDIEESLLENLQKAFEENFSLSFGENVVINIYDIKKETNLMRVIATVSLVAEQIEQIFGSIEDSQIESFIIFIEADYIKRDNEWIISGNPVIHLGTNLELLIESLNEAQNRAGDARIQVALNQVRTYAEFIRIEDLTYVNLCNASNTFNNGPILYGYDINTLEQDIYDQQKVDNINCYADVDSYCISIAKASDSTLFFCFDSHGNLQKETSIPCTSANDICSQ